MRSRVPVQRLDDDAIEAGAFEVLEPVVGDGGIASAGGYMQRRPDVAKRGFELLAPNRKWLRAQVLVSESEEIEGDEGCRRALRKQPDPRTGRMDSLQQSIEI